MKDCIYHLEEKIPNTAPNVSMLAIGLGRRLSLAASSVIDANIALHSCLHGELRSSYSREYIRIDQIDLRRLHGAKKMVNIMRPCPG